MARRIILAAALLATLRYTAVPPTPLTAQTTRVGVTEDATSFTLSNGIGEARILKSSGGKRSLQYKEPRLSPIVQAMRVATGCMLWWS